MKKEGVKNRVNVVKEENSLIITIKAFKEEGKQKMLLLWIILFSLCGIAIFSQFFGDYENSVKIFFGVYVAFWFFFEFKIVYAYRWRNKGLEKAIIENDQLILIKEIGKRGISQSYALKDISTLRLFKNEDSDFVKSMTSSYWNINKYTIAFNYQDNAIPFGIDLSKQQAKMIIKEISKFL